MLRKVCFVPPQNQHCLHRRQPLTSKLEHSQNYSTVQLLFDHNPREPSLKGLEEGWGSLPPGVHLHGTMEGKVSENVALKEAWSLIMGSATDSSHVHILYMHTSQDCH